MTTPVTFPQRRRFRWRYLILGTFATFLIAVIVLILSFRMGGEARVIRKAVFAAAPGEWNREFEFGVGVLPVYLARSALGMVELEPEARLAIQAVHSADVGIYSRNRDRRSVDTGRVLRKVRSAMRERGWEPLVMVHDRGNAVAVFVPEKFNANSTVRACVCVLEHDNMVLVSARANTEPLVQLALEAIHEHGGFRDGKNPLISRISGDPVLALESQ